MVAKLIFDEDWFVSNTVLPFIAVLLAWFVVFLRSTEDYGFRFMCRSGSFFVFALFCLIGTYWEQRIFLVTHPLFAAAALVSIFGFTILYAFSLVGLKENPKRPAFFRLSVEFSAAAIVLPFLLSLIQAIRKQP